MFDCFYDEVTRLRPKAPETVYHYCHIESLKYLVRRDSDIWCTHCNHLNDSKECWTGMKMFLEYLRKHSLLSTVGYSVLEESLRESSLWNKVLAVDGHSPIMPFSFSFSEAEDEPRMWNYTNGCGYRIAFDGDLVDRTANAVRDVVSALKPQNRTSLSLWPCFYEKKDRNEIDGLFDAFVQDFGSELAAVSRDPTDEVIGRRLAASIAAISPIFKEDDWSYEREWRLIMTREDYSKLVWCNHRTRSFMSTAPGGLRAMIKSIEPNPNGDIDFENKYLASEV